MKKYIDTFSIKEYKINPEGEMLKVIYREIGSKYCFVCGSTHKKLTRHHLIPQRLKPFNNLIIPLCLECHRNIHELKGEGEPYVQEEFCKTTAETSVKGIFYHLNKKIDRKCQVEDRSVTE